MTASLPPAGTRDYVATIVGTWDPGSVPALSTSPMHAAAQDAATSASQTALAIKDGMLEFYIISTDQPGAPVARTRWRVEATAAGPTLEFNTAQPHESELTLSVRIYPHSQTRQVVTDDAVDEMPYRGVLAPGVVALLLRHHWGPESRTLTLDGFGSGTFIPTALRFRDTWNSTTVEMAYDSNETVLAPYALIAANSFSPPAMWLTTTETPKKAWQISYCIRKEGETAQNRWDRSIQSAPEFNELTWPADHAWSW